MPYTLLIADDEIGIRELLNELFKDDYSVRIAEDGEKAIRILQQETPDVALIDIRLPKKTGIQVLHAIQESQLPTVPIIITADRDVNTAITAMKTGAFDYVVKPFENEKIVNLVKNATEKIYLQKKVKELSTELTREYTFDNIIGSSKEMQSVYKQIKNVLDNDATVLISGESGTGKELIARAVHYNGKRKDFSFVPVDCASIPETLIESELFGYEKGAYTGAMTKKIGKFELANHGTIFLDEIGNLRLDVQAKLLRIIQEKEFSRVGGNEKIKVDVRIISATNANLEQLITELKFREDLYYRLNVVPILLPPLRERKDDIQSLTQFFLNRYNKKYKKETKMTKDSMKLFMEFKWPGNVRELENTIQRLILTCEGDSIGPSDLPGDMKGMKKPGTGTLNKAMTLDDAEKFFIKNTLIQNNYNISKTAKVLGVTRKTLHNKLDKYPELKKLEQKKEASE
ncbi:MAG: sigma-54 dependent transcriptional regulator [bacterium]|nr:sigma-54 dependent transcriptional regulator [bacterium]